MRALDWASTAVGPVGQWPQSLKTSVSTCLNSRFPILVWWGPDLVKFYNDAYAPILGRKHPGALGAKGRDVWPEIWHIIGPMLEGVLKHGEATRAEDLLLELVRDGYPEECYFSFSYSPIRDESGNVGGVFTPVHETTGRVIGERRLRTLGDLAGAARVANAQSVRDVCDIAMETLARNPYDIPFAVLCLNDATGVPCLTGTAGIDSESGLLPELLAAADGGTLTQPRSFALPEDAPLPCGAWPVPPVEAIALPIVPAGQRAGFLIAAISPRKRLDAAYRDFLLMAAGTVSTAVAEARAAEDERRRAEALAELDRAKTAFFSNISHEFRTPLQLMLGPVEDALHDSAEPLGAAHRERLNQVRRSGLRLRKLVDHLLEFSRIEAGRMQASFEPVDLAALTRELASTFRSTIESAGLTFTVDCPPLDEPVYVDRSMWEKVVLNFLSNAFKFTLHGSISVSLRRAGDSVELSVADTGVGIPEAELPRIFDRFYRVEATRGRSVEGSGIGLALVHELVRLHGGNVVVASTLGQGSTFTASVPLGKSHLPPDRVHAAPGSHPSAAIYADEALRWLSPASNEEFAPRVPGGGRARVLLADDNADMRSYIARLLAPAYDVVAVADGREALRLAQATPPDIILSDVMMPGLDGFELLDAIRLDPRISTLPVILLSARAGEEARVEGLARGADDYLTKPFTARELLARIEARLELARARAEAARMQRHGQELLESVIGNTRAGIALVRASDYRIEWLNPSYRALAPGKEMLGCALADVWAEIWEELRPLFDQVSATGETYEVADAPYRIRRAPSAPLETRYFSFSLVAIELPNNGGPGILNTFIETTERLSAQQALHATNERLQRVLAAITDGFYELDREWRFVAANPVAEKHMKRSEAGLAGHNIWQLNGMGPGDLFYENLHEAVRTGRPAHFEHPSRINPGVWSEVHVYPKDSGVEVYFRDITDRKLAEQAMRESQERFRRLFEANIAGIVFADSERIYDANDAFLQMIGWTREEVRGGALNWHEITPPEYRTRDEAAIAAMLANGSFQPFEKEYFRKNGDRFSILIGGTLLQREPMQCLCFLLDLTERKLLERRILEAQKLESLGIMAGGIAHDFNNLLVGVLGNASLAQEMLPENHPAMELLDVVINASEHAALLTKQMLAYSGKGRFVMELVDLSELAREVIAIVQRSVSKKIGFHAALAGDVPPVEADRGQMQQISTNLILNAAEAIGDQSGTVSVTTGSRHFTAADIAQEAEAQELTPGEYVFLRVADTGCGMTPATLRKIFDPFFTTKFTGRGLGLAAVAGIVRGHKGMIRVTSTPGAGSVFTVLLPASTATLIPPREADRQEDLAGAGAVLLIDDEPLVRSTAKRTLEEYGYRVRVAGSGPEALELLRAGERVSAILLDLNMPLMNGLETLLEIRKLDAAVPVVLSSGYNQSEAMRVFDGVAVSGFLQKPYTSQELARVLKSAIK